MIRLLPGDCRDVLPTLPANSVHCVVFAAVAAILRYNERMNDGRIKKGQRLSPATEFKPGQHWRPHGKHREREWLEHQYVTLGKTLGEIAKTAGLTEVAVTFWMNRHGISRRSMREVRALRKWTTPTGAANPMFGRTGAANPRYVDGSSPERQRGYVQAIGRAFLRAVYKRDGYRCVHCHSPKKQPRWLHVHHIAPWAGNEALRFDTANAVTLCQPCHSWVHSKANIQKAYLA